ncbi:MAG: type II secretion system F family protein [Candidatus Micrarchaeia archaeon]
MKIQPLIHSIGSYLSFIEISPERTKRLEKDLVQAGMGVDAQIYARFSIFTGFVLFILTLPAFMLFLDFMTSLSFSLLLFPLSALMLILLPKFLKKLRARRAEAELPYVLRLIATEISLGLSFENALESATNMHGILAAELKKCAGEIRKGGDTRATIWRLAESFESPLIRRALSNLLLIYEHGSDASMLRELARDTIAIQRGRMRETSARAGMLGLIFIAVSCIVPSLFLAYVIVGSSFLDIVSSYSDIIPLYLFFFPLLDFFVIMLMFINSSFVSTPSSSKFLSREEFTSLASEAERLGIKDPKNFFIMLFLVSSLLFIVSISFNILGFLGDAALPIYFLILMVPLLFYLLLQNFREMREREIEHNLPSALYHAASFPRGVAFEKIIDSLAQSDYGTLSEEFARVSAAVHAGSSVESALKKMGERYSSALLKNAVGLIARFYLVGSDMCVVLKESADEVQELFALTREQASMLSTQKYTILLASSVLLPLIMGLMLSIASEIGFEKMHEAVRAGSFAAVSYILAFSLLAGFVVAHQEGNTRKFIVYFLAIVPIALSVFILSQHVIDYI